MNNQYTDTELELIKMALLAAIDNCQVAVMINMYKTLLEKTLRLRDGRE